MEKAFAFTLLQAVAIRISGEQGRIRARSQHVDAANQYLVSYKTADGRAAQAWFWEDQLEPIAVAPLSSLSNPATSGEAAIRIVNVPSSECGRG